MDRATVIVALPPVDDRVNKVSSEKEAHLTLLYLGDVDLSAEAVLYVQHACSELSPFGLSVDYRGELGEDKADVLFFEKRPWDMDRVKEFMHHLLLNDEIKRAYDSADQFSEWTPHLTLGYPEAPANEDDEDDKRFHYLDFDRIAVWTGDFEGPEFRLKYDNYGMDVAMSDMTTVERGEQAINQLFHYGKKGMRWGVRNDDSGGGGERGKIKRAATKANVALNAGAKVIDDGEKKLVFLPQKNRNKAAAATQAQVLATAAKINRSAEFKGKDLKADSALRKSYFDKVEAAAKDIYADELGIARTEAWGEFFGIKTDTTYMRVTAASNRIKHAEDGLETLLELQFELGPLGHILGVNVADKYLKHSDDDFALKHYGVKGMRWGVTTVDKASKPTLTREKKALLGPKDVTVNQRRAGKHVTAKGGQRQTATSDAVKAAAGRQKAKKSTTDSLSNDELKATIERMQLETQFRKLSRQTARQSVGQKIAEMMLNGEIMNVKVEPTKGK